MNIIKKSKIAAIYFFVGFPFLFFSCSKPNQEVDKSKWAVVKLPEGADTTSEYWKGIDLDA